MSTTFFPSQVILSWEQSAVFLLTWILRLFIIYFLNSNYDLIPQEFNIPIVIIDIATAKPAILKKLSPFFNSFLEHGKYYLVPQQNKQKCDPDDKMTRWVHSWP